jgi:hypothetical protein
MTIEVKILSPRCRGDSIIPRVATSHQTLKRDEKAITESLN